MVYWSHHNGTNDAGSNHFGIAGYYSLMAIKEGLLVSIVYTYVASFPAQLFSN